MINCIENEKYQMKKIVTIKSVSDWMSNCNNQSLYYLRKLHIITSIFYNLDVKYQLITYLMRDMQIRKSHNNPFRLHEKKTIVVNIWHCSKHSTNMIIVYVAFRKNFSDYYNVWI